MKKKLFLLLTVTVSAILLCACGGPGYEPGADENYFRYGDVYRVFTQQGEPERIEKYGLNSLMLPTNGTAIKSAEFDVYGGFKENSMFFSDARAINREGVIAIYDYLDISDYELLDEFYLCGFTDLCSFNKKIETDTKRIELDLIEGVVNAYGDVADVSVYTFSYFDRSVSDGAAMGSGTFKVILSDKSYHDRFIAYR